MLKLCNGIKKNKMLCTNIAKYNQNNKFYCGIHCNKKEYYTLLPKVSKKKNTINNETTGITAELALCNLFNIDFNSNIARTNNKILHQITNQLKLSNVIYKLNVIEHIGNDNTKIDFICNNQNTLSLKTNKKKNGKIVPQGGQATLKSFDNYWNLPYDGLLINNSKRYQWLQDNYKLFLNCMLSKLYCCDYLLHINNCDNTPFVQLLKKPNLNYFNDNPIIFDKSIYKEKWSKKKNKYSEFSTNLKINIDNNIINIGELQFHKSSRKEIKFRFYYNFLMLIS